MNDSFGHEALRRESDEGAFEIADDHPPEKGKIEQLGFAWFGGRDQRDWAALVNNERREEESAEAQVRAVEPGIRGPSVESRGHGVRLDPGPGILPQVQVGDSNQDEEDGINFGPAANGRRILNARRATAQEQDGRGD